MLAAVVGRNSDLASVVVLASVTVSVTAVAVEEPAVSREVGCGGSRWLQLQLRRRRLPALGRVSDGLIGSTECLQKRQETAAVAG